ncbi:MAG: peptidylprolyl isomerase [Alphaproteobacteria bacterium]|nr:peptidylprolyl isomerase [Alphaproteobacteria bacterium]
MVTLRSTVFGILAALAGMASPAAFAQASNAQQAALANPPADVAQRDTSSDETPPTATSQAASVDARTHDKDGVVAFVNDIPISEYDVRQRVGLVMVTSSIPHTPEMEKRVRTQVLEELETEMLQRQEALKNDITVSSVEVDQYINGIIKENNMTMDQLKEVLGRGHVALSTLRSQISASILWRKAVQAHYAGRVNISPEMVDAEMARISEGANRAHFAVAEIFLPVDSPEQDEKVRKDALNIEEQIQGGGNFGAMARQFSQSPSAAAGGDMGMVYDGQLAPELNQALEQMKTGDISQPIRSIGGYYILALRQRFEPLGTKIAETQPSAATLPATLPLARILLPLPPNAPKDLAQNAMSAAGQFRARVPTCDVAAKVIPQMKGWMFYKLGDMRLADLSQDARDALAKTEPGGSAEPFRSAMGIELFMRCDKAIPKLQAYQLPTRDQVEQQLFEDQISALARRYNRDLKRNADIETR